MKSFTVNSILFVSIFFTFFLANVNTVHAQNCVNSLNSMNSNPTGIPATRIMEYENCVASLDATETSKNNNKELLKTSYNKLISYYEALNKETKANDYKTKLKNLTTPPPSVPDRPGHNSNGDTNSIRPRNDTSHNRIN